MTRARCADAITRRDLLARTLRAWLPAMIVACSSQGAVHDASAVPGARGTAAPVGSAGAANVAGAANAANVAGVAGVALTPAVARDPRIAVPVYNACLVGDSLFRQLPRTIRKWTAAVPIDSVWYGDIERWACRVVAAGHTSTSALSVDTLMATFRMRGWSDRVMISADGPDGTVQAVHRAGVTCIVQGRWEGGDDSDTTAVVSDTIEVRLACMRSVSADTLMPPLALRGRRSAAGCRTSHGT